MTTTTCTICGTEQTTTRRCKHGLTNLEADLADVEAELAAVKAERDALRNQVGVREQMLTAMTTERDVYLKVIADLREICPCKVTRAFLRTEGPTK